MSWAMLGSPGSWNKYAYALNNPVKYVDPDGLKVAIATGGRSKAVRKFLARMARRPSGRAMLSRIAADPAMVVFRDERRASPAGIASARRNRTQSRLPFARTQPNTWGPDRTSVDVSIDTSLVETDHYRDRSGVMTTAHEAYHVEEVLAGKSVQEVLAGDKPSNASGPAAQHGELIFKEGRDFDMTEAYEFIDELLVDPPPE